jgi:hypothetical protein
VHHDVEGADEGSIPCAPWGITTLPVSSRQPFMIQKSIISMADKFEGS